MLTRLMVALALVFSLGAAAEPVRFTVEGLDGELARNVELYLKQLPDLEPAQVRGYRDGIRLKVEQALQALGHYNPHVDIIHRADAPGEVRVAVQAGEPVRYRSVDIQLLGEAGDDDAFQALLAQSQVRLGAVLNHPHYDDLKAGLTTLALHRGYFDGTWQLSEVRVHPRENAADVTLHYQGGRRYRFGELNIDSDRPVASILASIQVLEPGQPYLAAKLAELSRALSATGYFQQVLVRPQLDEARDGTVPLKVSLKAKADNQVEVGIGVSTDEGPRTSLKWRKPWINDAGHSLGSEFKVSAPRQELSLDYRIPRGDPRLQFYSLQGGFQRLHLEDTDSRRSTAAIHRFDKQEEGWNRDLFIRAEYETYTQADQEDRSFLLIPGISFERIRLRGGIDPHWGDSQILTLEFSERKWGSDARFVRAWGRSKWLRSLGDRHRVIARIEQGAVWVDEVTELPPSLRFFTGGDNTVRGFGYRTIGPRDADGELVGGKYSTALGLEYDYRFADRWRVAAFVDGGTATNDYQDDWKLGTGLGLRWLTPIGPIRFDLAFGVSEVHVPWRLHFAMGAVL
ncbi:autotransporter assembly complex family protein [Gallaecimonas sp. GXIMD4217]|uniref:autotransporter assembly complex protein TamA n=1 Tax=Gallaecimonas sp. GXIMD4217 TaxID=3131927 RepID=UPI00311AC2BE